MNKKTLKFDKSIKNYKKAIDNRLDEGDDLGALSMLLRIKDSTKNLSVLKDIANLYSDMGMYGESINYWFKYLDYSGKKGKEEIYNNLAMNYYYLGNMPASTYYFNEQFILKGKTLEVSEDVYEDVASIIDDVKRENLGLKFVYPPSSIDYSETIEEGKKLISEKEYDKAIEKYNMVSEGSTCYEEALYQLGVAYFMKGDAEKGIDYSKQVIEKINPHNINALANISSMYAYLNKTELSSIYYRKIEEKYATDINDYYKIATSAIEHEDLSVAIKYLNKITEEKPFEVSVNFMLAIAYFNNGNVKSCLQILHKLIVVTESNPIALYYYRKISYISENKEAKTFTKLPYYFKLPEDEEKSRLKLVDEYYNKPSKVKKNIANEEFWELIDWVFYERDLELQSKGILILSCYMTEEVIGYMLDKLIDYNIYDEIKEAIIRVLCMDGYNKPIGVTNSNFYKKIEMTEISFSGKNSDIFIAAYALAFSYLSYNFEYDTYKLYDSADYMFYNFSDDVKVYNQDIITLSAVMLLKAEYKEINIIKKVASIFGADKDAVKDLFTYIKEKSNG